MEKKSRAFFVFSTLLVAVSTYGSDIDLGGKKDLVLSKEVRGQVLELSENLLRDRDDDFVEGIAGLDNPFVFEQVEEVIAETEENEAEPIIKYNDDSILRAVAGKFSQQVRGTLIQGEISFLQLEGGTLIRPGMSFPVSIPQAQNRSFTVTVTQITGNSYILSLGEANQLMRLSGTTEGNSRAFRTDESKAPLTQPTKTSN
jgi:hypothetical protein